MVSSGKVLALLVLAVIGLAQALEEDNTVPPKDEISELEAEFDLPDSKFGLMKLFVGQYYQNIYNQINDYLIDHLESPDSEKNLQLALDWLNKEKAKPTLSNKNLIEALTQFTALTKTKHRCDKVSYAILVRNNRATFDRARTTFKARYLRRIDSIIWEYAFKHAQECNKLFPELYQEKLATMDQDSVLKIEEAFKGFLESVYQPRAWELLGSLSRASLDHQYLHKVRNEKTGKLGINESKVKQLLNDHFNDLRKPCKHYVAELGTDYMRPIFYDSRMLMPEELNRSPEVVAAMKRFQLCKIVLRDQEKLLSELKETIKEQSPKY